MYLKDLQESIITFYATHQHQLLLKFKMIAKCFPKPLYDHICLSYALNITALVSHDCLEAVLIRELFSFKYYLKSESLMYAMISKGLYQLIKNKTNEKRIEKSVETINVG